MAMPRNLEKSVFAVLCLVLVSFQLSDATVYNVGDSAGWTTIGNVDYKNWAAANSFQIGDIIVFQYNSQFHNVLQVKHAAYKACNASSPISTHTTGNDSFTIDTYGHHFFLCGVPRHCQAGQKVDIHVVRDAPVAPSQSGVPPPAPQVQVPALSPNNSTCLATGCLLLILQLSLVFPFSSNYNCLELWIMLFCAP